MSDLEGYFDIEFVGGKIEKAVRIKHAVMLQDGTIMWLVGLEDEIYNWTTIIKMSRINHPSMN